MISLRQFRKSILYAVRGIILVFKTEQSFRIQLIIGCLVLALALMFDVRATELIILLLLIGLVLGLELVNSIFERIVDAFKPRLHPAVRDIKDIMAGAVLVASIVAAVIGMIIFWPRIVGLF